MKREKARIINSLLKLDEIFIMGGDYEEPRTKSAEESKKLRQEGNKLYAKDEHNEKIHLEILRLYSRSVAFAPPDSEELGLAYGNRSAFLVHVKKYEEAVQDIERAIRLPTKELNKVKYLSRKLECTIKLKWDVEAQDAYEEAELLILKMKASEKVKNELRTKLMKIMDTVEGEMNKVDASKKRKKHELPEALASRFYNHQSYECPGASEALHINYNSSAPTQGRHIVATRNIAPGEILYIGEPYVCFPTETKEHLNCSHCLRFAWTALPCRDCVHAVYCSEECRELAKKLYHDVECKVVFRVRKDVELCNSVRLMSMRILIMAFREAGSLEELKESFEDVESCTDVRRRGFSNSQRIFASNHRSFYSLMCHIEKNDNEDLKMISEFSAVLVHMLGRHTTLFKRYFLDLDNRALAQNEHALYVGQLLSYFQHQATANSLIVKDTYVSRNKDADYEVPEENDCAGFKIIPFMQLFNHSCNPNIAKCDLENRKTVIYAILPIAEGEQVYDCYGGCYYEYLKVDRQQMMDGYLFECECIACVNDWPHYVQMHAWDNIECTVTSMYTMQELTKMTDQCEHLLKELTEGREDFDVDILDGLIYTIMLVLRYTKQPNLKIVTLLTTFRSVFDMFFGYFVDMPATC